jgi:hypothetical protein
VNLNGVDNFYVSGGGWVYNAGGIYSGSDLNLKDNVTTISGALQKINAMRGVTYQLKTEVANPTMFGLTSANTYIGVVAQEVEAVAPEFVRDMPNGTKAVAYQNMVGLLIQAIKEQNQEIERMKLDLNECCTVKTSGAERTMAPEKIENIDVAKANKRAFLGQNRPNPFSQNTTINYFLPESIISANILVFDLNGKLLKTYQITEKGENNLLIDGKQFQAGMYLYSLVIDGKEVDTKRMILTEN